MELAIGINKSLTAPILEYGPAIICLQLGGLDVWQETSMSSKLISGVAGLVLSVLLPIVPASADTFVFGANLTGPAESPPNASPGVGTGLITFDDVANTMRVRASFSGLTSGTTASHIHCCTTVPGISTAIVATTTPTFPNFPLGVTSGTYDQTFNMLLSTSYNSAFLALFGNNTSAAFAALIAGAFAGTEYLNIHTTNFMGGEIRGFLAPVPLPAALPLFATGLGVLGLLGWRRKRKAV